MMIRTSRFKTGDIILGVYYDARSKSIISNQLNSTQGIEISIVTVIDVIETDGHSCCYDPKLNTAEHGVVLAAAFEDKFDVIRVP